MSGGPGRQRPGPLLVGGPWALAKVRGLASVAAREATLDAVTKVVRGAEHLLRSKRTDPTMTVSGLFQALGAFLS